MNAPQIEIEHALWLVTCDAAFMTTLHECYLRDRGIVGSARLPFDGWIRERLDCMAGKLGSLKVSAEDMSAALRINATGDVLAVAEEIDARDHGFNSGVSCYVEEGVVFSSLWLRGFDVKATMDRAKDAEKRFRSVGYSAEVYVDENDPHEVTVNAQIDLDLYQKKLMDGTLAKKTSICRGIMI